MVSNTSRSSHLVKIISDSTTKIEVYRQEQGLPPLSLGPDAPLDVKYPPNVEQCRRAVIDASLELGDLATGPVELRLVPGWAVMTMFGVTQFICDFDIAHRVPMTGDVSYEELSKTVKVGASVLRQVLRAGMPYHMFYEPRPGHVAHTATTKVMAREPLIKDWTGLSTDVLLPASAGLTEALRKEPAANDPAKTGFMLAKGDGESGMFKYIEKHPEQARRFAGVMGAFQQDEAYAPQHLIDSWPDDLQNGKLVDLGGSTGAVAFAMAEEYPGLEIVVQDLPGALEAAQVREGRNVSFMPHDFFNEQPVKDADVFMFRWVLHNWPDVHVQRILRALIPSLKPGAKIIIFDEIMPPAGTMTLSVERYQRNIDFGMLTLFNSKIRDVDEWKEVITQSDQRFRVADVRYPESSRLSLIEIVWQP
ncbi:S-adenosyl-L-methionine-dependent methyltransferase [Penicillium canescens]|uniref:S-adenosyl-L-methionine-dependent methyltransferase n=1 Tax=Penicillium canescens TaxID=5083 RepID=A0AAD6N8G5_PENCN|nr:S-adenosyl-L-methionine-dependent methyltransferase [Penicillium canescens]KAJ6038567.1 S-adenosyl-L-methionine-dependent methyltransferase [Penicillium canescens]KAJ6039373.1 S-adenosyl-L-methionine-dependent methyltransferase [Penicillium canescens]KAJ6068333.1 S-adenosyl-L-methionine-dependent methyltransferase [Penicillium canescens]KAJ6084708.1 S-adenosyl-L-methionine-dependent methyltransferase [Penicillium canescens]KAJ6161494.1 S-adenosyl-L-methionine-dependent methyltransferase [Pe